MSRRVRQFFYMALVLSVDMLLAVVCFLVAYAMRLNVSLLSMGEVLSSQEFRPYLHLVVVAPIVRVFSYSLFGIYDTTKRSFGAARDIFDLLKAVCLGSGILIIVAFLYRGVFEFREYSYPRMIFPLDWLLNLFAVTGVHSLLQAFLDEMKRRGVGVRRVAVQGVGKTAQALLSDLDMFPEFGFKVVGFIADGFDKNSISVGEKTFARLDNPGSVLHLINKYKLDEIIVTNVSNLGSDLMTFVDECHKRDVVVKLVPDFYGILMQQRTLSDLAGHPVIQINEIAIVGFSRILKRIEDIVVATATLVLTSWILVLAAIAIKWESRGPILFRQLRVGKHGRHFVMYKFRSMVHDAEQRRAELESLNVAEGHIFKIKDDPRITRVGRLLRRTSIDELPQLFNVLRGDMSLVGPRPPVPNEVAEYEEWEKRRLGTMPGVTGLWQVNRSGHSFEEVIKWDFYYIENWSLWLDFKILLKTVGVVLFGKGAY